MNDIFGFLNFAQWLALLRIAIGLWWIKSVLHKPLHAFLSEGMVSWTVSLADNHPVPAFGALINRMVGSNATWFPYLVVAGEAAAGIGLTLGLLTPVSALVAIFLNLNYLALAGVEPKDRSVNPAYQCEQGQNLVMIAAEVLLFVMAAGSTWSIDSLMGIF
jgi:thiosulfate dehydrogenase [quinone] large subunit